MTTDNRTSEKRAMPECEGGCLEHSGDVQLVHVVHPSHDWGNFFYCESAIKEDRIRGMQVEVVQ